LNEAIGKYLDENKSPSRKVNELDNRGSHFYLALYWAQALSAQTVDAELQSQFSPFAETLAQNEQAIVEKLIAVQGPPMDIGGYFHPDEGKTNTAMRPSELFNDALAALV
jgi:isocitrate dehydrogenase